MIFNNFLFFAEKRSTKKVPIIIYINKNINNLCTQTMFACCLERVTRRSSCSLPDRGMCFVTLCATHSSLKYKGLRCTLKTRRCQLFHK